MDGASASFALAGDGFWNYCYRAEDNWGTLGITEFGAVLIDKTPPTIIGSRTPPANPNGWNNTDVTVNWSCADALSGVQGCPVATNVIAEGVVSVTGTAMDRAGNTASATVSGISIDKTPPTITATHTPPPNVNGWNNTDVTVSWTCNDALSGIGSCSSPTTVTNAGANQTVTGTATDRAGNSTNATSNGINIDKMPPVTTATVNPPSGSPAPITVMLASTDNLAGVQSLTYRAAGANPIPLTTITGSGASFQLTTPGSTTVTFHATDGADNAETDKSITVTVGTTGTPAVSLDQTSLDFGIVRLVRPADLSLSR